MNRTARDAAHRTRRPPSRVYVALGVLAMVLSGCTTPPSTGTATTTMTVATGPGPGTASSGPGVQVDVETGVPEAVVSFRAGAASATDTATTGATTVAVTVAQPDEVRRGADGDLLVITWGSTTCPRMPATVTAVDLTTVDIVTGAVRVGPDPETQVSETYVCTTDLGPTTSTVRLPEGAAGAGPLTVVVDGVAHALA